MHTHPALYAEFLSDADSKIVDFALDAADSFVDGECKSVLDVGCGLGRELAKIGSRGYRVRGIDASEEMLRWARQQFPDIVFETGDQRNLNGTGEHDLVLSFGSVLLHNRSLSDLRRTINSFRSCLRVGGVVVIELRNGGFWFSPRGREALAAEHFDELRLSNGNRLSSQLGYQLDLPNGLLIRKYVWEFDSGERIVENLTQRLLLPGDLRGLLEEAGFSVISMFSTPEPTHGDWPEDWGRVRWSEDALDGPRTHVVARRSA